MNPTSDKSNEQSLAGDILAMISAAREQGVDTTKGFSNQPFAGTRLSITFLFFPRKELLKMPGMPDNLRKKLRPANVMVRIDEMGRTTGLHLICTMKRPFSDIDSVEEVAEGIDPANFARYEEHLKKAMKNDFDQAVADSESPSEQEN